MGPNVLVKQLLKNLCNNSPWNYAVFWKIQVDNNMLLAWEDGYCENLEEPNELYNAATRLISFDGKMDAHSGYLPGLGCPIELTVANMSSHLYILGDGIVGNVLLKGNHLWINANSELLSEYPAEWHLQIASGIKTILLIPVLHGVVQLGSLQLIEENASMVFNIKKMLNFLEDISESISPFSMTPINHLPTSGIMYDGLSDQPLSYDSLLNQPPSKKHSMSFNVEQVTKTEQTNTDHYLSLPPFIIHDSLPLLQANMQQEFGTNLELPFDENLPSDTMSNLLSMVPEDDGLPFPHLSHDFEHNSFMNQSSNFATEDISHIPSQNNDHDDKLIQSLNPILLTQQPISSIPCKTNLGCRQYDSYSSGDDSIWTLPTYLIDNFDELEEFLPTVSVNYESNENNSPDDCQKKEICHELTDGNQTEHHSSDVLLKSRHSIKTSSNSSGDIVGSCVTQNKSETCLLEADHLGHQNHADSGVIGGGIDVVFKSSPVHSTSNSGGSLACNEEKPTSALIHEKNITKRSSKVVKKKSKSGGDTQKQRPRDRQLIQDRMKELRELVPQSEKCSIDSLLERTIMHMVFLKSLSAQAAKLNKCAKQKVDRENKNSTIGATWAYEMGCKPEVVSPILVENLGQPGHMLVEMLCNEYCDFLDIAQIIKKSELVILTGAMEKRCDQLWACFIIEASRGFDRLDILWPLMCLLQHNNGAISNVII